MFTGIITPIVTPFHRDNAQTINLNAMHLLVDHLITHGVSGIFPLGSNGEFHVVSDDERIAFASAVIQYVDHRVPVYVGTGACSTGAAVSMSQRAEAAGADALSVITPYFIKPTDDELVDYFSTVAASVHIPIILYNIPKSTGCNIPATVVEKLARIDNIQGIKDSSGNLENLQSYIDVAEATGLHVLIGSDSKISQAYEMGASGAIAGTSNLITDVVVGLDHALRSGDKERAKELQAELEPLRAALKLGTVPSILKRAIELSGIAPVGPARLPAHQPDADTDKQILMMLKHYGLK
ncbi:dihydrodipicolinate synthase family protein [Lacticaseibacillus nasuensis]|uniref:Dihydrodipicolinate synthetase n=1 Tax=Lacticaseibacillus nasuensis JCM 17158 TaxID=1291734 RepID=A0A0R1JHT8_9LACO|nr:dihydrodipicolinate synthase family protein [Lacticaseibacillus nasuensis]KRK70896.1 dihydrodipicolinate synthetase [Lacticaseibacillus nasuensis JCM 17158]